MIPHSLIITNFLSYRETVSLDLRDIHLACISGLNGAGKSTILDGITWALFGESRSSRDDDIVNRIAAGDGKAAEVQYVFELEGSVYRVIRRKAAGKTTELELHIRAPEDSAVDWRALTEARLKETQSAINELLRMNYDIFTNASFLLQGEADEFTTKTPDKRKQILADILGVSQWDTYKAQATENRKGVEAEVQLLKRQIEDIDLELSEEPQRVEALKAAEAKELEYKVQLAGREELRDQLAQTKQLAEQQRQRLNRLQNDTQRLEVSQNKLKSDSARRQAELDQFQEIIGQRAAIEQRFAELAAVEKELAVWQEKADTYHRIMAERRPHETAIAAAKASLEQQLRQLLAQREQAAAMAAERNDIQSRLVSNRADLNSLSAEINELMDQRVLWEDSRKELHQLETEYQLSQQEHKHLQERLATVEHMRAELPGVSNSAEEARARLAKLVEELAVATELGQRLADKRAEQTSLRAEQDRLRKAMDEQAERIAQLEKDWAVMRGQAQPDCPLCGQPLTEEHQVSVLEQLRKEGKERGDRYRHNKARIAELDEEIQQLEAKASQRLSLDKEREIEQQRLAQAEARLVAIQSDMTAWENGDGSQRLATLTALLADTEKLETLRLRVATLEPLVQRFPLLEKQRQEKQTAVISAEARLNQIELGISDWEGKGRQQLSIVQKHLDEVDYAVEAQEALSELDKRLADIEYEENAHQVARQKRANLADAHAQYQLLSKADAAIKPLSEALADLSQRHEENLARLTELETEKREVEMSLEQLESATANWQAIEAEVVRLREEVAAVGQAVGAARQRVEVLQAQRERGQELGERRKKAEFRVALLKELEEACGRRGVQALLIESALPEIEDHANDLLVQLTGGEMRVKFETQRELKTSNAQAETLDIKISDSTGERPYENYSGGEKFRVNFAIRLALSQVLARRAGARLRMLVIDEGFGSQDQEGRQRLVEAINTVQSEFACILVITHIDELRDKFPVRIEVEKTPAGSRANVVAV